MIGSPTCPYGKVRAALGFDAQLTACKDCPIYTGNIQCPVVAGADTEQDRASPENPDGDGQQTAHDDSKTRE